MRMSGYPSTILLVEDDPLIRLFLSELLEDAGLQVSEASSATEAMLLLEAGLSIDVLLTDVDMPFGCNGFELARQVHKNWPQTGIIVISGRAWPGEGDLPPGATFLPKPCPHETILFHVVSVAERARRSCHGLQVPQPLGEAPAKVLPFPKTA